MTKGVDCTDISFRMSHAFEEPGTDEDNTLYTAAALGKYEKVQHLQNVCWEYALIISAAFKNEDFFAKVYNNKMWTRAKLDMLWNSGFPESDLSEYMNTTRAIVWNTINKWIKTLGPPQ